MKTSKSYRKFLRNIVKKARNQGISQGTIQSLQELLPLQMLLIDDELKREAYGRKV